MSQQQEASTVHTAQGPMRPATHREITACFRALEARAEWEAVRDFAHQLFGEQAHHVEVVTGDAYDDEHYSTVVEDVTVYDGANKQLPYDLTLPYWSQVEPDGSSLLQDFERSLKNEEAEASTPLSQEEREQLLQEYAHEYVQDNHVYTEEFDLPRDDATFVLDESPEPSACCLYVFCNQEAPQVYLKP